MRQITKLKKLDSLENFLAYVSFVLLGAVIVSNFLNIVLRYLFRMPLPGVYEGTELLMLGIVYLPLAITQAAGAHAAVDVVVGHLPRKLREVWNITILVLCLAVTGLLVWQMSIYTWQAFARQDYYIGVVHFPLWPAKICAPLGGALLFVRLIIQIRQRITSVGARFDL